MDTMFLIILLIYAILVLVLLVFNVMAIRHILKYRFKGDASMAILLGYVIVVAVLIFLTTFSLLALSLGGVVGG
ncbi:MAG: hypothetical protein ACOZAR_02820 [Patescibacteria group bacterium]